MKNSFRYTSLILLTAFLSYGFVASNPEGGQCDSKSLKKEGISKLDPFYYSSSKVSTIVYDYKVQRKEISLPLFKGEKYKLVFNKKDLPKDVVVEIYDKDMTHDNREKLFTSEGNSDQILTYTPSKSRKMYVDYVIPASKGMKEQGCLVFILGYQLTFIKKEDKVEKSTTPQI